jgi:uncharacterized membrane protein
MPMLYAVLKLLHLLSLIVWVGGMFFTLACLRPALGVLDAPARPRLMSAVFARFFAIVNAAIGVLLLSGLAMLWLAWRASAAFMLPISWGVMIVLGLVMMGLFGYIRGRLAGRLQAALQAQDAPTGGATLARVRMLVGVNLALGVVVIAAMKLGVAA